MSNDSTGNISTWHWQKIYIYTCTVCTMTLSYFRADPRTADP